MLYRLILLVFAVAFSLCAHAEDQVIQLKLRPSVSANNQSLRLGEIATITVQGLRSGLQQELEQSVIVSDVRVGTIKFVSRQDVYRWFEQHYPQLRRVVLTDGASFARVDFPGKSLSASTYIKVGQDCLHSWLAGLYENFNVRAEASARDLDIPDGELTIVAQRCEFRLDSRITVMIEIHVNNEVYQTVPVTFAIDVTEPVWVATEKIQGRSLLESSRLEKQSRNIAATNGAFVRSEQEMDGMRLRRTIHPGEILTLALLEPMPDVVKGATVTVIAKVGGITISQGAIAREDGLLAQKVEVENVGNNNRYVARVIGKNTLLAQ